jgi:hypothetical protein
MDEPGVVITAGRCHPPSSGYGIPLASDGRTGRRWELGNTAEHADPGGTKHDDDELSVVSELLAFTAVGLVSTWGEVVPRCIPALHGRRVPTLAAVVPAALGAAALTLLWTWVAVSNSLGMRINGSPLGSDSPLSSGDWKGLVATVAYAPLLLWGPLLGAVTISYWKRRHIGRNLRGGR